MSLFSEAWSVCLDCDGDGVERNWSPGQDGRKTGQPCTDCRGTGKKITDIGRELVDFLREHYGLEPKP